ncbi:MAG: DUF3459 domain-containing protein, partial [Actinomycetes bacterium]
RLRRAHPALGETAMRWCDSPPDTLVLERDGGPAGRLVCAVNQGRTDVPLPTHEEVLLVSAPLGDDGMLPPDTAAWLRVG